MVRLFLAALLLLGAGPPPALAQEAPLLRVGEARRDADGDLVPDRLGETVTVAGRVTVASGLLQPGAPSFFLQSGGDGLHVRLAGAATIALGDSVIVTGVVVQDRGMTSLREATARIAEAPRTRPSPLDLDLASDSLERYEGVLARVSGYVAINEAGPVGPYLYLTDGTRIIVALAFDGPRRGITFEGVEAGDYVTVTGLIGQFDQAPPFDGSYQIYPRTPADVSVAWASPRALRSALAGGLVVLLLSGLWIGALRQQVRRRVRQLRATQDRHALLMDQAADAIFIHDLEGPDGWSLHEANQEAARLLDVPHDLTPGERSIRALIDPASLNRWRAHVAQAAAEGHAVSEITFLGRTGEPIPFEVATHCVDLGEQTAALSIARDFRARKAYEEGLILARREAEALAKLRSEFLANMSHEIRTPLTSIIGFTELLREEVDEARKEFTDLIIGSAQRLLATLNAVLDLARFDAGEVHPRPSNFDAAEEVQMVLRMLEPLARQKALALRYEGPGALPVYHDRNFLGRVINNLVGNAIKFTEAGSVEVRLRPDGADGFTLEVHDTGIGISEDFLPHLFDEFKQESTGLGRSHEGSGLGLTITRRLVEISGGSIEVASTRGQGTTFTVALPMHVQGRPSAPVAEESMAA